MHVFYAMLCVRVYFLCAEPGVLILICFSTGLGWLDGFRV